MDQAAIKRYIGVIRRACDLMEQQLDADTSKAFQEIMQEIAPPVLQVPGRPPIEIHNVTQEPNEEESRRHKDARKKHIDDLMAIDCWPTSVPVHAVGPTSESDQINRAKAVLDMSIGKSIEGAHFLDYGCGDGYIAAEAASRGCAKVTGYDIKMHETWAKFPKVEFIDNGSGLVKHNYDLVFLYDVLDHCHDAESVMAHVMHVTAPGGTVFVRCHPWTSKHATHLPKVGLNKSYIHLFVSWDELIEMGYQPMFTRMEKSPMEAYRWWFKDFKILKEQPRISPISEFFTVTSFRELLQNEQQLDELEMDKFLDLMAIDFVDFVLETPK